MFGLDLWCSDIMGRKTSELGEVDVILFEMLDEMKVF